MTCTNMGNITYTKDLFNPNEVEGVTFAQFKARILNGVTLKGEDDKAFRALFKAIRAAKTPKEYKTLKSKLGLFVLAGTFTKRNAKGLEKHSGLMVTDFDGYKDASLMESERQRIGNNKHVCFCFTSPSGNGFKAVVRIPASSSKDHSRRFTAFRDYIQAGQYWDESGKDVARGCFESIDANAIENLNAEPFRVITIDKEPSKPKEFTPTTGDHPHLYASHKLNQLCERLQAASKGTRHSERMRIGYAVGGYVASSNMNASIAKEALIQAARQGSDSPTKAEQEVITAYEEGLNKPLYLDTPPPMKGQEKKPIAKPIELDLKVITLDDLYERAKNYTDPINTGYKLNDDFEIKIPSGALSIIAAQTSHGKSTFLNNLLLKAVEAEPEKIFLYFTYEESADNIILKMLNTRLTDRLSNNNVETLKNHFRGLNSVKLPKEAEAFNDLLKSGQIVINQDELSIDELIKFIYSIDESYAVGGIFIDYFQLLTLPSKHPAQTRSRQEQLKEICLQLKGCAIKTQLPIVLASQFNRKVTSVSNVAAVNISEAGDIERIANLIIGFWNGRFEALGIDEQQNHNSLNIKQGELYVKILKNRDGQSGITGRLKFDEPFGRIENTVQEDNNFQF